MSPIIPSWLKGSDHPITACVSSFRGNFRTTEGGDCCDQFEALHLPDRALHADRHEPFFRHMFVESVLKTPLRPHGSGLLCSGSV